MSVNSETQTSGRPRRSRVSRVRKAVLAIAFALFCAGVVVAGGLGDACSVGYEAIAAVCPLGALEGFFGSWSFAPRMAIGLGLALVVVIVAGRALLLLDMSRPPSSGILAHKEAAASRRGRAEGSGRGVAYAMEEGVLGLLRRLRRRLPECWKRRRRRVFRGGFRGPQGRKA